MVEGKCLLFDERIAGLSERLGEGVEALDARGRYVLPGLFDVHIHGYLGQDASDGDYDGLVTMAEGVAKNGVTAFLPTTMTVSRDELERAFAQIARLMRASDDADWRGARAVGVNAEGPFINPARKGAQAGENILARRRAAAACASADPPGRRLRRRCRQPRMRAFVGGRRRPRERRPHRRDPLNRRARPSRPARAWRRICLTP